MADQAPVLAQLERETLAWSQAEQSPKDDAAHRRKAAELAFRLGAVRRANRAASNSAVASRAQVAARRQAAEHAQLRLASLRAERAQLKEAIAACRRFKALYPSISLHPLEEYRRLAALGAAKSDAGQDTKDTEMREADDVADSTAHQPDVEQPQPAAEEEQGPSTPEPENQDGRHTPPTEQPEESEHELMLARLRFELAERRRLEKVRASLQVERSTAITATRQRKAELLRLEQDIQSVMKVRAVFFLLSFL